MVQLGPMPQALSRKARLAHLQVGAQCSSVRGSGLGGSGKMDVHEQLAQRLGSALLIGHRRLWRSWQGHDASSDPLVECPSWELMLCRVRSIHPGPGFWCRHVM